MDSDSTASPAAQPEAAAASTHEEFTPAHAGLGEVARYFVRLGFTAFGGPAAHVAMMEDDLVNRRHWISRQQFMDTLAATQLVPGPNSTEMAIHMGYVQRGVPGLIVAGACFIGPAFLLVLLISIGYVAYGTLPQVNALFYGIQPIIVAIVIQAVYRLGATACRTLPMIILAVVGALLQLLTSLDTVLIIIGGGLVGIVLTLGPQLLRSASLLLLLPFGGRLAQPETEAPLWQLGLFFLKVGATLMGSGYVLLSYLETDLVRGYGWLTRPQLIDAIAVGQMTPGPVFTTAAFVGYVIEAGPDNNVLQGMLGAAVAAVAIFLPSFLIVLFMAPWIPRLRQSRVAGAFLDGVNAAVVGSIAAITWTLFATAVISLANPTIAVPIAGTTLDIPALLLAVVATFILLRYKLNSTWLIGIGAVSGLLLQSLL